MLQLQKCLVTAHFTNMRHLDPGTVCHFVVTKFFQAVIVQNGIFPNSINQFVIK